MNNTVVITKDCEQFVKDRWELKFPMKDFKGVKNQYLNIKAFAPDGNVWESNQSVSDEAHYFMRLVAQYYLTEAFKAMKIDMNNPNVAENLDEKNISTPGRIAKVWLGGNPEDDSELGSGRWNKPVRIASFPNTSKVKIPITKRVDFTNTCSHHFLPMTTTLRDDSYAFISYIPDEKVIGISKLQRLVNSCKSFVLQEDATKTIYDKVVEAAGTTSVYFKIVNAVHMCEKLRGSLSDDGAFSSEYYGGLFEDPVLRAQVDRSV